MNAARALARSEKPSSERSPEKPRRRALKEPAPRMMGNERRKAKRAACSRVSPRRRPPEIAMPERLMPGISASA